MLRIFVIFSFYHNKSLHKLFGIVQVEVFSVKNSLKKNIKFRSYEFHTNDIEPVSTEKEKKMILNPQLYFAELMFQR